MQPEQVTLCPHCTKLTISNSAASQLEHWPTLEHLRPSSVNCAICKILLGCFDERVKEALHRFRRIGEPTAEQSSLSLTLIDSLSPVSGIFYKFIEAGISLPNTFQYTWSFHIAACESPSQSYNVDIAIRSANKCWCSAVSDADGVGQLPFEL
jgi:hypothetical protein